MMDPMSLRGRDVVIDVDSGVNANRGEEELSSHGSNRQTSLIRSGTAIVDESIRNSDSGFPNCLGLSIANGELSWGKKSGDRENTNDGSETNAVTEKPSKKKKKNNNCKKPPRPPRPPIPLDAAEEKLVREFSQLAMLKRARIERMKAMKKMNNTKTTSSTGNFWAFIITVIFCLVIFWQGFCSRSNLSLSFEGSPISSVGNNEGLISIQYHNNASGSNSIDSNLSPSIVEHVSGSETTVDQVSGSKVQGDESVVAR